MINEILAKIPERVISSLDWYIINTSGDDDFRSYGWAIFGVCMTLIDLGVLSLTEGEKLYEYYYDLLENGGNAR